LISHHMQDAAILNIGVASDPDEIHIAAHDGIEPDAGMVPDHNITDENCAFRNVDALAELRQFPLVFKQHHSKLTEVSMLHQLHGPAGSHERAMPIWVTRRIRRGRALPLDLIYIFAFHRFRSSSGGTSRAFNESASRKGGEHAKSKGRWKKEKEECCR
jgi:hypothetical protein